MTRKLEEYCVDGGGVYMDKDDYITEEEIDRVVGIQSRYNCPKHGLIDEQVFSSNIPNYEGIWCMRCIIDVLNANPCIHRVTDLADESKEEDDDEKKE